MKKRHCLNFGQCQKNHSIEQTIFRAIIRNDKLSINTANKYTNFSDYQFLRHNPSFFKKFVENKAIWIKSQVQQKNTNELKPKDTITTKTKCLQ